MNLFSFVGSNPVKFTDKFGLERDWRSEMPNGGRWSQMKGGEFTALFGASPAEIVGWTTKGMFSNNSKCCLTQFAKCMFLPDFTDMISATNSIVDIWEATGWVYGPNNLASSLYLGATAIITEWKWYKFTGTTATVLKGLSTGLSVYTYGKCWLEMKKCMGW